MSLCCSVSRAVSSVDLVKLELANLTHKFEGELEKTANTNQDTRGYFFCLLIWHSHLLRQQRIIKESNKILDFWIILRPDVTVQSRSYRNGSIQSRTQHTFLHITAVMRPLYGLEVDSASNRNENQEYILFGKGGRRVVLTNLPPSCADCLEIW
jgi:hypothetical protein